MPSSKKMPRPTYDNVQQLRTVPMHAYPRTYQHEWAYNNSGQRWMRIREPIRYHSQIYGPNPLLKKIGEVNQAIFL